MTMYAPKTRRAANLLTALWGSVLLIGYAAIVALIIILHATAAQMFSLIVVALIFFAVILSLLPTYPAEPTDVSCPTDQPLPTSSS